MNDEITTLQKVINTVVDFLVHYSFQVVGAFIVLIVGWIASIWLAKFVQRFCERKNVDITLTRFISGLTKLTVIGFAVIIALGKFGITIAPFIAAIGGAAFGATYAIQGPLSNYGAGLSLILSRPFKVGKTISVAGVSGVVQEIKLSSTVLVSGDGSIITVPNKHIVGEILLSSEIHKMIEGTVGVSYESDPEKAIGVIQKTLKEFKDVATNPGVQVGIQSFGDSTVNIGYRYWVPTIKYFDLLYSVNLAVYKSLQQASIKIPYPQREIRMISQS